MVPPDSCCLAAVAGPVALFGVLEDILAVEPEDCRERRGLLARLVPEHGIHRRGIDDLAGVENILRVPGSFNLPHELVILFADHLRDELAAKPTVAVLAAEGAAVFLDEGGYFDGDGAEEFVAFLCFQVDNGSQMKLAAAGVGIVDGVQSIFLQDAVKFADIGWQVLHIDGRIFDHRDGLVIAGKVAEQAEAGFAEVPDLFGVVPEEEREMISEAGGAHVGLQTGGPVRGSRRGSLF